MALIAPGAYEHLRQTADRLFMECNQGRQAGTVNSNIDSLVLATLVPDARTVACGNPAGSFCRLFDTLMQVVNSPAIDRLKIAITDGDLSRIASIDAAFNDLQPATSTSNRLNFKGR